MFDFRISLDTEATSVSFLIFLFLYLITLFSNRDIIKNHSKISSLLVKDRRFSVFCTVVMTIAAITRGDFYHYGIIVQNQYLKESHLEDIYIFLIKLYNGNYLMWRITVFGGALLCLYWAALRFKLNATLTFVVLSICYINMFNYARASLAFAIYFVGLSFIIRPLKIKYLSFIFGTIIIYLSHYFHDSAYILIAFSLFLFLPINKKTIVLLIICIPVVANVLAIFLTRATDLFADMGNDRFIGKVDTYTGQYNIGTFNKGLSALLYYIIHYGSYFATGIFICLTCLSKKIRTEYPEMYKLNKVLFGILLFAGSFAFVELTTIFFYRILYMAIIPLSLQCTFLISKGYTSDKRFRFCLYLGIVSILYETLYALYLRF